jgi:hypothetical protein
MQICNCSEAVADFVKPIWGNKQQSMTSNEQLMQKTMKFIALKFIRFLKDICANLQEA